MPRRVQLDLQDLPGELAAQVTLQAEAFLRPAEARLLEQLEAAGLVLDPSPVIRLTCRDPEPAPGDREWATVISAAGVRGVELVERVLVGLLLQGQDGRNGAIDRAQRVALTAIERFVDPTYVPAHEAVRPPPPSTRAARPAGAGRPRGEVLMVSISANAHDSSVAFADEHDVLLVLEAERVFRRKRKRCSAAEFEHLVALGLHWLGRELDDVTHWVGTAMCNPLLDVGDRICEWTATVPASIFGRRVALTTVNHHLAHAGMAFAGPFQDAIVEACDGGGDGRTYAAFRLSGDRLEPLDVDGPPFSAVFYDVISYYVYRRYGAEGKLMGLAAHGEPVEELEAFLDARASDFSARAHEESFAELHRRIGLDAGDPSRPLAQSVARAAQAVFERRRLEQVSRLVGEARHLVLTGGAALNIHANSLIAERFPELDVYVPPCCDDTGQALGAALYALVVDLGARPRVNLPFLGAAAAPPPRIDDATAGRAVDDLLAGKILAWHYGRAELGPRALGHRSLLSVPFSVQDRVRISERVKGRESYRPVAPVILEDRLDRWFTPARPSPYMLFAAQATDRARAQAPAVVHVDGSARIQTVARDEQPLGPLLSELERRTGVPILINTSLNGPGEPIADRPAETLAFARRHEDVVPWIDGVRGPA